MTTKLLLIAGLCLSFTIALAQPEALVGDISIRKVLDLDDWSAIRVDFNPANGDLYYATVSGDIIKFDPDTGVKETAFTSADHGLHEVYGFDIGTSGNVYLVSMNPNSSQNEATIKKYDSTAWTTMVTATYQTTSRQHRFNAVIETPDEQYILVNSGANTDHGEQHGNERETAFTAMLLKFPVDTENLVLENNPSFMEQYIFADGLRNSFDIEYDAEGRLFGCDQGPQGDHNEELNWLQEGNHYGFPWVMGNYDNPQQFADYDPQSDLLLSAGIESTHVNDPNFPPVPNGVTFTLPVKNKGPHQDLLRDPVTGEVKNGSETSTDVYTFTPHSSPLALTFDANRRLAGDYRGMGFCMTWSAADDRKIQSFDPIVEDLLMLNLEQADDNYEAEVTRLAQGFNHPVDACLLGNKMYVIEHATDVALWEVTFEVPEKGNILYVGGNDESNPRKIDQDLVDRLNAWGYDATYMSAGTYNSADASVYNGYDGIWINETVGSSDVARFSADGFPVHVVIMEPAPLAGNWGLGMGIEATDGNAGDYELVIEDNTHYITEDYEVGEKITICTNPAFDHTGILFDNADAGVVKLANVSNTHRRDDFGGGSITAGGFEVGVIDSTEARPIRMGIFCLTSPNYDNRTTVSDGNAVNFATEGFYSILERMADWTFEGAGKPDIDDPLSIDDAAINSMNLRAYQDNSASKTVIGFNTPHPMKTQLTVIDLQGRVIKTISSGSSVPGNNFVELSHADFGRGIYIIQLQTEEGTDTLKVFIGR